MKNKIHHPWTSAALAAILLFGLAGCKLFEALSEGVGALEKAKVADSYDPSEEYYIGRGVSAVIIDKYPPVEARDKRTERQITYVNEMAGYVEAATKGVTRSAMRLDRKSVV